MLVRPERRCYGETDTTIHLASLQCILIVRILVEFYPKSHHILDLLKNLKHRCCDNQHTLFTSSRVSLISTRRSSVTRASPMNLPHPYRRRVAIRGTCSLESVPTRRPSSQKGILISVQVTAVVCLLQPHQWTLPEYLPMKAMLMVDRQHCWSRRGKRAVGRQ